MINLSIDIGGTKVRVIEYQNLKPIKEKVYQTEKYFLKYSLDCFEKLVIDISTEFKKKYNILGVSLNFVVKNNIVVWSTLLGGKKSVGFDLNFFFSKYFSFKKFVSNNDVVCMAKAELKFGIGDISKNFLIVNLGTGIRVVNVSEGHVVSGYSSCAGEVSIMPIYLKEFDKYLNLESVISGRGVSNIYNLKNEKNLTAKEVFKSNDKHTILLFVKYLASFLFSASCFYNPEFIVFTGGLSNESKKWLKKVQKEYYKNKISFISAKKIIISKIENPASIGALLF